MVTLALERRLPVLSRPPRQWSVLNLKEKVFSPPLESHSIRH